jgi:hypothetical protein
VRAPAGLGGRRGCRRPSGGAPSWGDQVRLLGGVRGLKAQDGKKEAERGDRERGRQGETLNDGAVLGLKQHSTARMCFGEIMKLQFISTDIPSRFEVTQTSKKYDDQRGKKNARVDKSAPFKATTFRCKGRRSIDTDGPYDRPRSLKPYSDCIASLRSRMHQHQQPEVVTTRRSGL